MPKKIGLALGCGGARGLAHIGVIKTLVKNNIPIDYVAGSSIGALIGSLYAATLDILQVEKWFLELTYKDLIKVLLDPSLHSGLIKGEKFINFLQSKIGVRKIEELKIPFRAVATDLFTGKAVVFKKGDLGLAIRSSCAVPFLFSPIILGDKCLVDGGISMPVPVQVVKEMGADIVIAVNLDSEYFIQEQKKETLITKINLIDVLEKSIDVLRYHLSQEHIKKANLVINPKVNKKSLIDFIHAEDIIRAGEKATLKVLPELLKITQ